MYVTAAVVVVVFVVAVVLLVIIVVVVALVVVVIVVVIVLDPILVLPWHISTLCPSAASTLMSYSRGRSETIMPMRIQAFLIHNPNIPLHVYCN